MRLIDADELIGQFCYSLQFSASMFKKIRTVVERIPTIDAVSVKHGQWIVLDECSNAGAYCSVCHKKVYKECYGNCKMKSTYCPNCGAKMDLEDTND